MGWRESMERVNRFVERCDACGLAVIVTVIGLVGVFGDRGTQGYFSLNGPLGLLWYVVIAFLAVIWGVPYTFNRRRRFYKRSIPLDEAKSLDQQKAELEIHKLQLDIRRATSIWHSPLIQMTPTIILIGTSLIIAYGTGLLDARREQLETKNLKLQWDKDKGEQEVAELNEVIEDLNLQVESLNVVRKVQAILSSLPNSSFARGQAGLYALHLHKPPYFKGDDHEIDIKVLEALNEHEDVHSVHLSGFVLGKKELKPISGLSGLKYLELTRNELNDDLMELLSESSGVEHLVLDTQEITTLKGLSTLKLKSLRLANCCNLNSAGFLNLERSKDALLSVDIVSTPVDDEIIPFLQSCKSLNVVWLGETMVTQKGINTLLEKERVRVNVQEGEHDEFVKRMGLQRLAIFSKNRVYVSPFSDAFYQWWMYSTDPIRFISPDGNPVQFFGIDGKPILPPTSNPNETSNKE